MARTQLTAQLLQQFEQDLKNQAERFDSIERQMNNLLNRGFLWDDPVAQRFRIRYAEQMEPLRSKLLPAMDKYQQYLRVSAEKATTYSQE
jgi:hypothetical protein